MNVNEETPNSGRNDGETDFLVRKQFFIHRLVFFLAKISLSAGIFLMKYIIVFVFFCIVGAIIGFERLLLEPHTMTPNLPGLFVLLMVWEIACITVKTWQNMNDGVDRISCAIPEKRQDS